KHSCSTYSSKGEAIRLGAFNRRSFDRLRRQRRSFSLARTRLRGAFGRVTVGRISSRVSCASFPRTLPSSFTADQCFAGHNFEDHRDNFIGDNRSERPESPDPEGWSKATTRYAKWARKDYRLLLRPDERQQDAAD